MNPTADQHQGIRFELHSVKDQAISETSYCIRYRNASGIRASPIVLMRYPGETAEQFARRKKFKLDKYTQVTMNGLRRANEKEFGKTQAEALRMKLGGAAISP